MGGRQTGTIYCFGADRPGQLARITALLNQFSVTILNLRVHSGMPDAQKCDFVRSTGGPLAENQLHIAFDKDLDEKSFSRELQRVCQDIGYSVTCLVLDSVWR